MGRLNVMGAASLALALVAGAAEAQSSQMAKDCASQWAALKVNHQTGNQTHKQFNVSCMAQVPLPAPALTATDAKSELDGIQADSNPRPQTPAITSTTTTHHASTKATTTTTAPAGTTAICKDGTTTKSKHQSGTCSHHGGVAKSL